jgi:hypothetical protein
MCGNQESYSGHHSLIIVLHTSCHT